MMDNMHIELPAIRGIQARAAFYVITCPFKQLARILSTREINVDPEARAQRALNASRVPAIARYVTQHADNYVLSSLCISVDGEMEFEPAAQAGPLRSVGRLRISLGARILINDGQHRAAALARAVAEQAELANETISILVFPDRGLKRAQQMFADLNAPVVKPARSIRLAYDHRDERTRVTRALLDAVPALGALIALDQSSLSRHAPKLFPFSALHDATRELLKGRSIEGDHAEALALAARFWTAIIANMPDWQDVLTGQAAAADLRRDFVHAHAVTLQAVAVAGAHLINTIPGDWEARISAIAGVDWRRANTNLWEGRALAAGKVNKGRPNVLLVANVLLQAFGLPLSADGERAEQAYAAGRHLAAV